MNNTPETTEFKQPTGFNLWCMNNVPLASFLISVGGTLAGLTIWNYL